MSIAGDPRSPILARVCSPTMNSRSVRSSPRSAVVKPVATTYGRSCVRPFACGDCNRPPPLEAASHLKREEPLSGDRVQGTEVAVFPRDESGHGGRHLELAEASGEIHIPFERREPRYVVVIGLVEEIGSEGNVPKGHRDGVAETERGVGAGSGIEVVMDAQRGVQHSLT